MTHKETRVKKFYFSFLFILIGYVFGSIFPPNKIIEPQQRVRFTADYVIKAGTEATRRRSVMKDLVTPIEIYVQQNNSKPILKVIE